MCYVDQYEKVSKLLTNYLVITSNHNHTDASLLTLGNSATDFKTRWIKHTNSTNKSSSRFILREFGRVLQMDVLLFDADIAFVESLLHSEKILYRGRFDNTGLVWNL